MSLESINEVWVCSAQESHAMHNMALTLYKMKFTTGAAPSTMYTDKVFTINTSGYQYVSFSS